MRNLLLISMLVMAPLSFASYHGGGSGDSSSGGSSGGGGYGSGSSGAAAGLLLVGGLIYFLNRDSDEEVTEEFALVSKNKVNKFDFNLRWSFRRSRWTNAGLKIRKKESFISKSN